MKKPTNLLLSMIIALILVPINSLAATLQNLPSKESSKQWEVIVGKADSDDTKLNKSTKPDLYNVYSLNIKNIGDKDIKMVKVEAYRDEPNSTTQYELFTVDYEHNSLEKPFHHQNFPLYTKATQLKVIVTWTKKSDKNDYPRKYSEQFVFQQ
ncbi:hypothetical protein [Neobacillus sp. LXY-1]|uniref:hypothetical protein n=1 Tax=Neobacillus sp. LXY-1 TaxID=3379133 RepID=UPI003EE2353F